MCRLWFNIDFKLKNKYFCPKRRFYQQSVNIYTHPCTLLVIRDLSYVFKFAHVRALISWVRNVANSSCEILSSYHVALIEYSRISKTAHGFADKQQTKRNARSFLRAGFAFFASFSSAVSFFLFQTWRMERDDGEMLREWFAASISSLNTCGSIPSRATCPFRRDGVLGPQFRAKFRVFCIRNADTRRGNSFNQRGECHEAPTRAVLLRWTLFIIHAAT